MKSKKEKALDKAVERATSYEETHSDFVHPEYYTAEERAKMAKQEMKDEWHHQKDAIKEEKENDRRERYLMKVEKQKRIATKKAGHRGLKNFFWWLFGLISFVIIFAGAVCAVAFLVPVNKIGGEHTSEYVSEDIGNSSIANALLNITNYTVDDIPALQMLIDTLNDKFGLNNYVVLDLDAMSDTKVISQDMLDGLSKNVKVVATLASVGMDNLLDMSAFKDFVVVPTDELPDESTDTFNYRLYYYEVETGKYDCAFGEDHKRISDAVGKTLYYPALNHVVLTDLGYVFVDRLDNEKMTSLLSAFGMDSGTIVEIVGDRTVSEMKSFDINEVKLSVVFNVDGSNEKLRSSLINMTYDDVIDSLACDEYIKANSTKTKTDWDGLTDIEKASYVEIAENSYPTIDNYACAKYLDSNPTKTRADWNLLTDIEKASYISTAETEHTDIKKEQYDLVKVGNLSQAQMDAIQLTTIMPASSNPKLYDLLRGLTGKATNDEIVVGDLNGADVDNVQLSSVLEVTGNESLYATLRDMTYGSVIDRLACEEYLIANPGKGKSDWEGLTSAEKATYISTAETSYPVAEEDQYDLIKICDLSHVDMNAIKLLTVMPYAPENEKMYAILCDMSGKVKEDLTVGDMSSADVSQIKIASVMTETSDNAKLYNILEDMTKNNVIDDLAFNNYYLVANPSNTKADWDALSDAGKQSYISDATTYYNGIADNEERHKLIRVAHMGNGDVTHIRLVSILDNDADNARLYTILRDLTYENVIEQYIFDNYGVLKSEWQGKGEGELIGSTGKTKAQLKAEAGTAYSSLTYDEKIALITIASLDDADISAIKLSSVLTSGGGNKIIEALLTDDTVTVGNMADKANDLKVSDVYGVRVFASVSEIDSDASLEKATYGDGADVYYAKSVVGGKDVYTLSTASLADEDKYYITNEASIWLFMLYDCPTKDSNGFGTEYTGNGISISQLDGQVSLMSAKITSASIRQLVSAGVLSNSTNYGMLYATTLDSALSSMVSP